MIKALLRKLNFLTVVYHKVLFPALLLVNEEESKWQGALLQGHLQ